MRTHSAVAICGVLLSAGCYIDFRHGLQCRTNADCFGLTCQEGTCGGDAALSGTDGGEGASDGVLSFVSSTIYDDTYYSAMGNGDGVLNRNETVRVNVKIKNSGATALEGVTGTLSTTSTLVAIDDTVATQVFGDVFAKSEACIEQSGCWASGSNTFRITVPSTTPDGTELPFTLTLSDSQGNNWSLTFSLLVTAPDAALTFVSNAVYDDDYYSASGNGDGILNRNETIRLNVKVKNTGTSALLGVNATLTTTSALATVDASQATHPYGDIPGKSEACIEQSGCWASGSNTFRVTVPSTTPDGTVLPFKLSLTDGSGNSWPLSFSLTVTPTGGNLQYVSWSLYDDDYYGASGNGDGVLNKGEIIRLNVKFKNTGTAALLGVMGTLSSTNGAVTVDSASATQPFGDIAAGSEACVTQSGCWASTANAFRLTVSGTAANYAVLPMKVMLADNADNHWSLLFDLHVYPSGAVVVASTSLYDATAGSPLLTDGNGNARWEGGEIIRLNIGLHNTGSTAVSVQTATVSVTSGPATILNQANAMYPSLGGGGTSWVNNSSSASQAGVWRVSLASGTVPGTRVSFELTLSNGTTTWKDWFTLISG